MSSRETRIPPRNQMVLLPTLRANYFQDAFSTPAQQDDTPVLPFQPCDLDRRLNQPWLSKRQATI